MLNKIYKISLPIAVMVLPFISYAQLQPLQKTGGLLSSFRGILEGILIPLAFTLALLFFFWGVAKYIWSAGDKEEGKKIMVWGIVALFVMSSVWGLVYLLRDELGVTDDSNMDIPGVRYGNVGGSTGGNDNDIN